MSADPRSVLLDWCGAMERIARAATPGRWTILNAGRHDLSAVVVKDGPPAAVLASLGPTSWAAADSVHIARHDPPTVLAQVVAVRNLVSLHSGEAVTLPNRNTLGLVCGCNHASRPDDFCVEVQVIANGFVPGWRDTDERTE